MLKKRLKIEVGSIDTVTGHKYTAVKIEGIKSDVFAALHLMLTNGQVTDHAAKSETKVATWARKDD